MPESREQNHYIRLDIPKVELSPKETRFLESLRNNIARALAEDEIEFQRLVKSFVGWEIKRHEVQPPHPSIALDKVTPASQLTVIAGFGVDGGDRPVIYLFLLHPVIREDPAQLILSIFHEFQHYLSWKRKPANFQNEKALPPEHPIEKAHETTAVNDLTAMIREGSIGVSGSRNAS